MFFIRFFSLQHFSPDQVFYFIFIRCGAQSRLIERDRLRPSELKTISREAAALRIGRCWCGLTNEYWTTGLADRLSHRDFPRRRFRDGANDRIVEKERDARLLSLKLHEASDNYRELPLWILDVEIDPHSSAYVQRDAWDAAGMHLRFVSVRLLSAAAAINYHRVFHCCSLIIRWTYHGLSTLI